MVNFKQKKQTINKDLIKKICLLKLTNSLQGKNKIIFKKSSRILKIFKTNQILIYKGFFYRSLKITKFIINFKFGEFAYTRKPFRYLLKSKK